MRNIILALGSHIPSPSKWIPYQRDPIFTFQNSLEPNNYSELTELYINSHYERLT